MSFTDAFFGSTQSQFAAYAIFSAVIAICLSIILTGTEMTVGNRLLLIFFVILSVLPSILLMLLQITCMVSGGTKDDHWWCWLYSWVIAIFVIIYCIFVVIISLTSLFTYNNAISKVDVSEQNNKMTPESSNNYAKMMIETNSKESIEKFMNSELDEELNINTKAKMDSMVKNESFENDEEIAKRMKEVDNNIKIMAEQEKIKALMDKEKDKGHSNTHETYVNMPENLKHDAHKKEEEAEKKAIEEHKEHGKKEGFYNKDMIDDDEPEAFNNRNYATFR